MLDPAPGTSVRWADAFEQPPGVYLLSHSVGLLPKSVPEHVEQAFFHVWRRDTGNAWPRWLEQIDRFRNALAALLGGEPGSYCPQVNLSSGLTKILWSVPAAAARPAPPTLLLSEEDFPSMGFVASRAAQHGFRLQFIDRRLNTSSLETWERAITSEVSWILLTHVQSNTGVRTPVRQIVELAREREVITVIDVAQSAGIVPVDVGAWDADFVLGSCVKWLCGGPGAGFLWANPRRLADCEPFDVGWFSHADPFELDIHHFRYADDARRFWGGTPSIAPYVIAARAIECLHTAGVEHMAEHNAALTTALLEELPADVVRSPLEPQKRGGTVVLHFGERQQQFVSRLERAGVHFDRRLQAVRLSPHLYNTAEDIAAVRALFPLR